jgi:type IV pilus assembly protein PilW
MQQHSSLPTEPAAAKQRGVTLVEMMVGMLIGLLAVIVISQVMLFSEGQKRTTTGGSDAQVNGALALYALQRDLEMAGYGLTSNPNIVGCPIDARYNGARPAALAANLVPVLITKEADRPFGSVGDAIRVFASSKTSYSVPTRVSPGYAAGATTFLVTASLGVRKDDLAVVAIDATQPCWVFQATAEPTGISIERADNAALWNEPGKPNIAYPEGSVLVNLGNLIDNTYQLSGTTLQLQSFNSSTPTALPPPIDIQPDIVNMRALYGKDIDADGDVDSYDDTTPTTNAGWKQVIAIRVVVVARSGQYEKDEVTQANLRWDVGSTPATAIAPPGTAPAACGTSMCLPLKVDHLTDWKHYRYKQFDTVIPLRNMLWTRL